MFNKREKGNSGTIHLIDMHGIILDKTRNKRTQHTTERSFSENREFFCNCDCFIFGQSLVILT